MGVRRHGWGALFAGGCVFLVAAAAQAQTFREHTRSARDSAAGIDEAQAVELTLTVVRAARQTIQTWIRAAGAIDGARQVLTGCVAQSGAALVQENQRVRAFPPDSKSSIYQARVIRVAQSDGCVLIGARLSGPVYGDAERFVMEIIVDLGQYLAIPNEAIIEREGTQVVYVQREPGQFEPREIHTGRRGELYTEVLDGLVEGERVVTLGSFFIDADYRLKATAAANTAGNAHQHH